MRKELVEKSIERGPHLESAKHETQYSVTRLSALSGTTFLKREPGICGAAS
jgi:hypothetical protein